MTEAAKQNMRRAYITHNDIIMVVMINVAMYMSMMISDLKKHDITMSKYDRHRVQFSSENHTNDRRQILQ